MTFPAYPGYKESGVEWLGLLPNHWSKTKIGRVSQSGMGQTILKEMLEDVPSSFSLPVYSASEGDDAFGYFPNPSVRLKAGDLVVGARGSIGKTRLIVEDSTCTQTTIWVKPSKDVVFSEYLYWAFVGGRESLFPFDKTAIPMLTIDQLKQGWLALPSAFEQTQIARFLDHETARIDALIEEQQRLIELLKEKRQAVISHAVTKGLDPTVPMKDSGVEWLGEVPGHWRLTPIKYLALLNPKKSDYDGDTEQLCSFVPMEKLKTGVVQLDEERLIEEVIGGYTYFEDGDVLQAKVTPCFENKNVAIAKGLTNGIGFGSSEINVLRPYKAVNAEYLYYRVQEDIYISLCTSSMIGAGGLKRVPTEVINNFKIAAPTLGEQTQIARFLDHETARIDALIAEANTGVALLQERRAALISAAVTGKIDVRDWQPQASTQAPEPAAAEAV